MSNTATNQASLRSLEDVTEELCRPESFQGVYHGPRHDQPMPSNQVLAELMDLLKAVIFPGYFGRSDVTPETMRYHVGAALDTVQRLLSVQINRGFCFVCTRDPQACDDCEEQSREAAGQFISRLPEVRRLLALDVEAAFQGDPAARTPGETIFCYPSITALTHYRIAHELEHLDVTVIPRIISEMAHSQTGIDIHPGAEIGEKFFIDHGTGTVIGETSVIGNNVRIYHGVTLGAKSFPKDDQGRLVKGVPRHPVVEDDVVIYSGATILGRVTIGRGSIVGGNAWLTDDLPPGSKIMHSRTDNPEDRRT